MLQAVIRLSAIVTARDCACQSTQRADSIALELKQWHDEAHLVDGGRRDRRV